MEIPERIIFPLAVEVESINLKRINLKRIYWKDFRSWREVFEHIVSEKYKIDKQAEK